MGNRESVASLNSNAEKAQQSLEKEVSRNVTFDNFIAGGSIAHWRLGEFYWFLCRFWPHGWSEIRQIVWFGGGVTCQKWFVVGVIGPPVDQKLASFWRDSQLL